MKSIMKSSLTKAIFTFFILVYVFTSPAFAVFCSKCGYHAKDNSVFCSKCGEKLDEVNGSQTKTDSDAIAFLEDKFSPVQGFETFLSNSNYVTCVAKFPEFKIEYDKNFKEISARASSFDSRVKKIMWLYVRKWVSLNLLYEAWSLNVKGAVAINQAYMIKYSHSLSQLNHIIDYLKNGGSLEEAEKMDEKLAKNEKDCKVTSKYLQVNKYCIPKGQPVWIEEVEESRVKVLHMGTELLDNLALKRNPAVFLGLSEPVRGWISKEEMKSRTDWLE